MTVFSDSVFNARAMLCRFRSLGDWLARKLSRVTSSGEFIPEIDGLRFIAIMTVIFHHLLASYLINTQRFGPIQLPADWWRLSNQSWVVDIISRWYFGVHLFFVISGFILALPFARKYFTSIRGPDLKSYYLRRVTRIEPPYVFNLVLSFVLIWIANPGRHAFVPHFIASLFYSHGLVYGEASWINGVSWSLEVEIQFYLVVPLLAMVFSVPKTAARRALLVASILFFGLLSQWLIAPSEIGRLKLSLLNNLQYFLAGFLLADLYLIGRLNERKTRYRWDAVVFFSAISILMILTRYPRIHYLLPFMVLLFYWAIFLGKISNKLIRLRPIVLLGGICYTTYLYHNLVIGYLNRSIIQLSSAARPLSADFLVHCLIQLPVIFIVCSCLFYFTEKPFMKKWIRIPMLKKSAGVASSPA